MTITPASRGVKHSSNTELRKQPPTKRGKGGSRDYDSTSLVQSFHLTSEGLKKALVPNFFQKREHAEEQLKCSKSTYTKFYQKHFNEYYHNSPLAFENNAYPLKIESAIALPDANPILLQAAERIFKCDKDKIHAVYAEKRLKEIEALFLSCEKCNPEGEIKTEIFKGKNAEEMHIKGNEIVEATKARLEKVLHDLDERSPLPQKKIDHGNHGHFYAHEIAKILRGLWKGQTQREVATELQHNRHHFSHDYATHIKTHYADGNRFWFDKTNLTRVNYDDLVSVPIKRDTELFTVEQFDNVMMMESLLITADCFITCKGCLDLQRKLEVSILQKQLAEATTLDELQNIDEKISALTQYYSNQLEKSCSETNFKS